MKRQGAGLSLALAVGAVLLTTGCESLFGHDGGRVQVVLARDGGGGLANIVADAASGTPLAHNGDDDDDHEFNSGFQFQAANVVLTSVMARTVDGELVALDVDLPISVDVVRIDGGRQVQLPDGFLPAGTYDQIVLVMTAVQGTLRDGSLVTVEPPGGGWTAVIPICPMEVIDGATETVGVAFNVRNSFVQLGARFWDFRPRFRSMESLASCETAEN